MHTLVVGNDGNRTDTMKTTGPVEHRLMANGQARPSQAGVAYHVSFTTATRKSVAIYANMAQRLTTMMTRLAQGSTVGEQSSWLEIN